jgi:hypothetical protein
MGYEWTSREEQGRNMVSCNAREQHSSAETKYTQAMMLLVISSLTGTSSKLANPESEISELSFTRGFAARSGMHVLTSFLCTTLNFLHIYTSKKKVNLSL